VAERLGFNYEGVARELLVINKKRRNMERYSLLNGELAK
jgi:RimJ/RimL family protein N-acetyltransferase